MCIHSSTMPVQMCSLCTPVKRIPIARPQHKRINSQGIPTWSQWMRFKQAEPLPHMALCIMCKQPISKLSADTIRIGCRVKVAETEKFTVCNVEYEQTVHKIIPVVLTGLGCPVCQYFYVKAQSSEMGRFAQEDAGYSKDLADPSKRPLMLQYGCTSPSKRQAVIDVTDLVLEMERMPAQEVQARG